MGVLNVFAQKPIEISFTKMRIPHDEVQPYLVISLNFLIPILKRLEVISKVFYTGMHKSNKQLL